MHQRTNYMELSENSWTRALDLKIQVRQTEEKIPCLSIIFKQWTKSEINRFYIWEFAWAYWTQRKIIIASVLIYYVATPAVSNA